jgi:hypothetical protein
MSRAAQSPILVGWRWGQVHHTKERVLLDHLPHGYSQGPALTGTARAGLQRWVTGWAVWVADTRAVTAPGLVPEPPRCPRASDRNRTERSHIPLPQPDADARSSRCGEGCKGSSLCACSKQASATDVFSPCLTLWHSARTNDGASSLCLKAGVPAPQIWWGWPALCSSCFASRRAA